MADSSEGEGRKSPNDSSENPAMETTIVGARPPARERTSQRIPRGIEVLIKKASVDEQFRALLLEQRAEAAVEIGLELSAAEAAMINAVPRTQIEKIIEGAKVPDEHRRVFLGQVAAAMLAVLGFGALDSQASEHRVGGIRPGPSGPGTGNKTELERHIERREKLLRSRRQELRDLEEQGAAPEVVATRRREIDLLQRELRRLRGKVPGAAGAPSMQIHGTLPR